MTPIVGASKRELAEVIGSQSVCGGWKTTDITIIFSMIYAIIRHLSLTSGEA